MATRVARKSIPKETKLRAWDKTLGRCWYCGLMLTWGDRTPGIRPHLEHQKPVWDGGTNDLSNLVFACHRCNVAKRVRDLEEFREDVKEQAVGFLRAAVDTFAEWHWYREGEVEREVIRWLVSAMKELEPVQYRFYGECVDREWDDYVI